MKIVHARFKVTQVTTFEKHGTVKMEPVLGKGNEMWAKATPAGAIDMTITNFEAIKLFKPGREYAIEFREQP